VGISQLKIVFPEIVTERTHLGVALNNMVSYFAWVIPCITDTRYAEFIHDQSHLCHQKSNQESEMEWNHKICRSKENLYFDNVIIK
jgi:hypothetical protein